jgi:hypothetical protein
MTDDRRARLWALFHQAADLLPEEQRALVDAVCAADPDLRAVAVDETTQRLQGEEPRLGGIVQLRYYAGLSLEETASIVGRSVPGWTCSRDCLAETGS